jgi:hypothetical protein
VVLVPVSALELVAVPADLSVLMAMSPVAEEPTLLSVSMATAKVTQALKSVLVWEVGLVAQSVLVLARAAVAVCLLASVHLVVPPWACLSAHSSVVSRAWMPSLSKSLFLLILRALSLNTSQRSRQGWC